VFCGVSDPTDVALKIGMVVNDIDLRKSLIDNARDLARKKYDWQIVARAMGNVFEKVPLLRKKTIVIATGIYPPAVGGSAEYAINLERQYSALGHRVRLVKYGTERFLPSGFRHLVFFFKCLVALRRADFVLALDNFSAAAPAVLAARIMGKQSCVRVGGDFLWEQYVERTGEMIPLPDFNKAIPALSRKERVIYKIIKWVFRSTDTLVFSTRWLSLIFADSYKLPPNKISIIENYFGSKIGDTTAVRKNFVWAGRNIRLKNLTNIEKAFVEARKVNPEIELQVVRLGHAELLQKIRDAYATISVSLSEVSPNFVIESVYCGKPFVTTKYCGISDRLGDTGLYADPNDVENIKEKILYLAQAKGYTEYLEKNRAFNFSHSWEEIALEFLRIITR
jgi:glycosyltransferase involved in cell wall biosynthesis